MKGAGAHYLITRGLSACLVRRCLPSKVQADGPAVCGECSAIPMGMVAWWRLLKQGRAVCAWGWDLQVRVSLGSGFAVHAPGTDGAPEPWKHGWSSPCVLSSASRGWGRTRCTMWGTKAELVGLGCRGSRAVSAWRGAPHSLGAG